MRELYDGTENLPVIVGAFGQAASSETVFLLAMRLNCRGKQTVNLGTGITLDDAARALTRHNKAEAVLLTGNASDRQAPHLARLSEVCSRRGTAGPVLASPTGAGFWSRDGLSAAQLGESGLADILSGLGQAAFLLPARAPTGRRHRPPRVRSSWSTPAEAAEQPSGTGRLAGL